MRVSGEVYFRHAWCTPLLVEC